MPMKSFFNFTYYATNWTRGEDTTMHRYQFDFIFRY